MLHDEIFEKARELGVLISDSEISQDYLKYSSLIKTDRNAQLLLSRLVEMGKIIAEQAERDEGFQAEESAESQLLKEDLQRDEKVRPFLMAQKKYLGLMELVKNALWNPKREAVPPNAD